MQVQADLPPPHLSPAEGHQVRNMLKIKRLQTESQWLMFLQLLAPGVTFQRQFPSSPQVALQSQLPARGPLGGGLVASPGTHHPFSAWPCCCGLPAFCRHCRHPGTLACLLCWPHCLVLSLVSSRYNQNKKRSGSEGTGQRLRCRPPILSAPRALHASLVSSQINETFVSTKISVALCSLQSAFI